MAMKSHIQPDPANLTRLIGVIRERLDAVPPGGYSSRDKFEGRQQALRAIFDDLAAQEGARVSHDWQGSAIRLAGIRSSSTSGIHGALANWVVAAKRKVAEIGSGKAGAA